MRKFMSIVAAGTFFVAGPVFAQSLLMMPDSTNNRLVLFDATTGAVVNPNYFGLAAGTPIQAMQVNNEIWVSEQIGDRVSRWSLTGTSLGAVTGALDNVRGMEIVGGKVYVASTGTANGAPGRQVAIFDDTGAASGNFLTPASSGFHILNFNNALLISSDAANDDIHRYSSSGTSLGAFHNSGSFNFGEQMDIATNGDLLAAAFSSNIVARFDPTTGAIISTFAASGARGLAQLGNGNIMWTSGAGAFVYDVGTQTSTQVYTGGGRFLDRVVIPEPGAIAFIAIAAAGLIRRR